MKKALFVLLTVGFLFLNICPAIAKGQLQVIHKTGYNHDGIKYTAHFYGVICKNEPRELKKNAEEYWNKHVKKSFADGRSKNSSCWDYPFFYYGEAFSVFIDASYDYKKNRAWKGFLIKKIVIEYSAEDIEKYREKHQYGRMLERFQKENQKSK